MALHASSADTLWRFDAEPGESLSNGDQPGPAKVSDKDLFRRGILWVRSLGIGLWMENGTVRQLVLRMPHNVPATGFGKITSAHLEMSTRDDFIAQIKQDRLPEAPWSWLQSLATLLLWIAIGYLVTLGVREQNKWTYAPTSIATIKRAEPPAVETDKTHYLIQYRDHHGDDHQARIPKNELIGPRGVGATVQVYFLADAPGKPFGGDRPRDLAFLPFVPWGIARVRGILHHPLVRS